jgi:hypothetical protein
MGLAADQRGLVGALLGGGDGGVHGVHVVAVHGADHVPAVGFEALGRVVDEPGVTLPSMEMPLSSYSAISLFSFQAPARAAASC